MADSQDDPANDFDCGRLLDAMTYDELRRIARHHLARIGPGQTLQPTALVHEAYLRLEGVEGSRWASRQHFVAAVARAMRFILVDEARRKGSAKHGGNLERVFVEEVVVDAEDPLDLMALDEAIDQLEGEDPRLGEFLNLRLFGGLTITEAAEVMGVSYDKAKRDWRFIKTWLCARLSNR